MAEKEKSLAEIQREIAEVELETKRLQLAEARDSNARFVQTEATRRKNNAQRQSELKQGAAAERATHKKCRHKSGGSPSNILKGGGKFSFSLITRTIMPDGKTELLQCQRCRLKLQFRPLTPVEAKTLEKNNPARYEDYLWWQELREASMEDGIPDNEMRGPTFTFQNAEGVNFIPELV